MLKKIDSLSLTQVTKDRADQTCGPYYYLVTTGAMSFTAFCTKYGFLRWLNSRGLSLTQPLVPKGEFQHQRLEGHYYEASLPIDEFNALAAERESSPDLFQLNNARYLHAHLETATDGAVIITHPWSGVGGEPDINVWHGRAIEDGVCYRTRPEEGIPDWLLRSPKEVIAHADSLPKSDLSQIEKAIVASSWLALADQNSDIPPLKHPGIVEEMTFQ
jgi:hypothetical protein